MFIIKTCFRFMFRVNKYVLMYITSFKMFHYCNRIKISQNSYLIMYSICMYVCMYVCMYNMYHILCVPRDNPILKIKNPVLLFGNPILIPFLNFLIFYKINLSAKRNQKLLFTNFFLFKYI